MSQKKRVLQQKILQAPVAIRSMRKTIIENANFLIEEMRQHDFTEVSEIVRACTALGIRRAYLRGLQHPIAAEGDINKFIHRFNMLGALPFQDQSATDSGKSVWVGGGKFAEQAFQYYVDTPDQRQRVSW